MILLNWIGYIAVGAIIFVVCFVVAVVMLGRGLTDAFQHNQRTCNCADCVRRRGVSLNKFYEANPGKSPWRHTHTDDTGLAGQVHPRLRTDKRAYPKGSTKKDISDWKGLEHPHYLSTTELTEGVAVGLGGSRYRVVKITFTSGGYDLLLRNLVSLKLAKVVIRAENADRRIWMPLPAGGPS
jgi:hypothetical protein